MDYKVEYEKLIEARNVCSICSDTPREPGTLVLSGLVLDNAARSTLLCNHGFHAACLQTWFDTCDSQQKMRTCPLCRRPVTGNVPGFGNINAPFWGYPVGVAVVPDLIELVDLFTDVRFSFAVSVLSGGAMQAFIKLDISIRTSWRTAMEDARIYLEYLVRDVSDPTNPCRTTMKALLDHLIFLTFHPYSLGNPFSEYDKDYALSNLDRVTSQWTDLNLVDHPLENAFLEMRFAISDYEDNSASGLTRITGLAVKFTVDAERFFPESQDIVVASRDLATYLGSTVFLLT